MLVHLFKIHVFWEIMMGYEPYTACIQLVFNSAVENMPNIMLYAKNLQMNYIKQTWPTVPM